MHEIGDLNTSKRKHCRRKIDTTDELVTNDAGFNVSGPSDNEWNVDAAIVEKLLATDVCAPVITHEKDDCVVRESLVI